MKTQRRVRSYDDLLAGRYGVRDGRGRKGPRDADELFATYYGQCETPAAKPKGPPVQSFSFSIDDDLQQHYRAKRVSRARSLSAEVAPAADPQPVGTVTATPTPAPPAQSDEDRAREEEKLDLFAGSVADTPSSPAAPAPAYPAPPPAPASTAKGKPPRDDHFMADMQSILTGQKAYDASTKTMVERSEFPQPPDALNDPVPPPSSQPMPQTPPGGGPHEIFEKIAQSMEYAGAYDMGSVEIENRFAQFDREREGKAVAPPPLPAMPEPPRPPVVAPPPVDTFKEDMQDMLARPAPVVVPPPPPPPLPMNTPPAASPDGSAAHDDMFFPDPEKLRIGAPIPRSAAEEAAAAQSLPEAVIAHPFYASGEHVQAAPGLYLKGLEVGPPPGLMLSYGDLIAMADLYESVESMMQQPLPKLQRVKDLLDQDLAHALDHSKKSPSEDDWEQATAGNPKQYLQLAEENFSHFAPTLVFTNKVYSTRVSSPFNHKERWEAHHKRAMAAARTPETLPWRNATPKNWPVTINAFGDHFLTDAFAGGHLFNKAEAMSLFFSNFYSNGKPTSATETFLNRVAHVAWHDDLPGIFSKLETADGVLFGIGHPNIDSPDMFARVLVGIAEQRPNMVAGLAVKVIHDKYNSEGIRVRNGLGDEWLLKGDSHLEPDTLKRMQAAVERSAADITDPDIQKPGFNPDTFCARVWQHVPQLTQASFNDVAATMTALFKPDSPQLTSAAAKIINSRETAQMIADKLVGMHKLRKA